MVQHVPKLRRELLFYVKESDKLRAEGLIVSLFVKPKKTGKFIDKLEEKGFAGFINLSVKPDVVYFEN